MAALQRQLRRQPYHVFHFIGHGGFDQQSQSGVLLLEDERGLSRLISGHHLGTLLHNHAALRLALLNACEGARTAMNDPFACVAQQLVQQGLPAVIAMQFEITDPAAITLAQEFYAALADGYPVDAALTEARVALFTQGNDIEWGTPVLYLRAQDGLLFAVEAAMEGAGVGTATDGSSPMARPPPSCGVGRVRSYRECPTLVRFTTLPCAPRRRAPRGGGGGGAWHWWRSDRVW